MSMKKMPNKEDIIAKMGAFFQVAATQESMNLHNKTFFNVGTKKKMITPIQYIIKRMRHDRE